MAPSIGDGRRSTLAKMILMDEFHLTVRVPASTSKLNSTRVVRALKRKHLQLQIHHAIDAVFKRHAPLHIAKITISR